MKKWILSIAIITLLIKIFKKYRLIRTVLKTANWTILSIFGISVIDAFGLGFLVNFFREFTKIIGNIVGYLSNTTFYSYIFSIFKSTEDIKAKNQLK